MKNLTRHPLLASAALILALVALAPTGASAGEIIPSIGISRSVDGDDANHTILGLALRTGLTPMLKAEVGVARLGDSYFGGLADVTLVPVTVSLWASPLPTLYAGGGVGWYFTTLDFASALGLPDDSDTQFGMHLGGGMRMPVTPVAALDFNGRYVMMGEETDPFTGTSFDPDFWMASAGIAFRF